MKVVPKNCSKKTSKNEQRKAMATIGNKAYLQEKPKITVEVVRREDIDNSKKLYVAN